MPRLTVPRQRHGHFPLALRTADIVFAVPAGLLLPQSPVPLIRPGSFSDRTGYRPRSEPEVPDIFLLIPSMIIPLFLLRCFYYTSFFPNNQVMDCVGDPINVYLILYKNILSGVTDADIRRKEDIHGSHHFSYRCQFRISELERN